MDGPKDHQTKSSKSERERQTSYGKTYVWNLKKKEMNLFSKQKQILWLPKGKDGRRINWVFGINRYTL